ncbi:MAG TPA: hypothetical protein VFU14_14040 [Acidimicrobiales bacterium]|nr:hypothetical protein [Acidimicrobiales bacterium]
MNTTPWHIVRDRLIRDGHLTENGVTRAAQPRGCRHCHTPVLVGLDGDVAAVEATVDPTPLSTLGEALAVLTGRRLYTLRRYTGRYHLGDRSPLMIRATPADAARYDVLANHVCGQPVPPTWAGPSVYVPTAKATEEETCPF